MRSKNHTISAAALETPTVVTQLVARQVTQQRHQQPDLVKYLLPKRMTIYNDSSGTIGYLLLDSDKEKALYDADPADYFDLVPLPPHSMMQDYNLPKSKYVVIAKFPGAVDTIDVDILVSVSEFQEYPQ